ncbi:glycoside hydrolase domain-containing protein [Chitinophagaceae bacterium LWZ2-11]
MKKILLFSLFAFALVSVRAQDVKYSFCNNCWESDSLGNHRAIVEFNGQGSVARVVIRWRRRDNDPQNKRIIVQDAATNKKVINVKTNLITRESGEIFFEPTSGKGAYYIYYMPYKNEGKSPYPKGVYWAPENTASQDWLNTTTANVKLNTNVKELQAVNEFNSFYPMEVIATSKETTTLQGNYKNKPFIIFPEDRLYSIKMQDDLPYRWITSGPKSSFAGTADRGEHYAYQLGLYALQNVSDVQINFSDLKSTAGKIISQKEISCINTTGTTYDAKPLTKQIDVAQNKVQALWCTIAVPKDAGAGVYKGTATVTAKDCPPVTVTITLTVTNNIAENGGVNEPWKQTRLQWLNSTLAQENTVIAPYTPLQITDSSIGLLGRKIILNKDGFPKQIQTFFTPEMTAYTNTPNNLLVEPIHFHFTKQSDGKNIDLKSTGLQFTKQEQGTAEWKSTSTSDALQMDVSASLEFDGFLSYTVKVTALQDIALKDVTMHIPMQKDGATYLMGLGQKGGLRPEKVDWKWDVAHKNQDGAWLGNVNAGLQFSLRDEHYMRPLNTNFYLQKPLLLPTSWGNGDKGGVTVGIKGSSMLVNSYTGERTIKKGEVLYFNFNLLITPFHTINPDFQWDTRFYHRYNNIDTIKATGATVVNIHHATPINPWINYPFIEWKKMKDYIDEAHQKGLKVKIYNTVRELSDHAYETFALRSLGHEVYSPGKGKGFSWLQEHIGDDYIAAWYVPEIKDAAIINSGMNRWHNYYVEGMNWLTKNVGIDGIYLDDVAFDRVTMKRIKRVLTQDGHPGIIDLHSANQYNKSDGFNNSANLYMEHFPYLNRLWFGEYFDYEKSGSDFFLTEVSGIPFGLMSEMLQDGGNAWRGMVYGMTNRMPWTENSDPRPIWKVWDDFGIKGSEMIGYWSPNCPVKTDNEKVLATVYKKNGATLVSIASWADDNTTVRLQIDWSKLGLDAGKATITAPEVKNFQSAKTFNTTDAIPIEKGKGLLLIIKN